jgi:hypothetical protein
MSVVSTLAATLIQNLSLDDIATLGIYATAFHPHLVGLTQNASQMRVLRHVLPHVAPLHLVLGVELLRIGMRATLRIDLDTESRVPTHDPPASLLLDRILRRTKDGLLLQTVEAQQAARGYFALAVLRLQRRLQTAPALFSALARVWLQQQGGYLHQQTHAQRASLMALCKARVTFTGYTLYDVLMRADPQLLPPWLPSAFAFEHFLFHFGTSSLLPGAHARALRHFRLEHRLSDEAQAVVRWIQALGMDPPPELIPADDCGPMGMLLRTDFMEMRTVLQAAMEHDLTRD